MSNYETEMKALSKIRYCPSCGLQVVHVAPNHTWAHAHPLRLVIETALKRGVPVVHDATPPQPLATA